MRSTRIILEKMRDYCSEGMSFIEGVDKDEFVASRVLQYAVSLVILQLGELAGALPEDYREEHGAVPWRQIRGMRNMIAHDYVRIDKDLVWETACNDLPVLYELLCGLLDEIDN